MEAIDWKTLTAEQRDILVAEKIFNWKQKECEGEIGELPTSSDGWSCQRCGHSGYWGDDNAHQEIAKHYSTNIGAAWLIVGKMRNDYDGSWLMTIEPHDLKPNLVTIFIGSNSYSCKHAFMAEAICIAALRAVGCEVNG